MSDNPIKIVVCDDHTLYRQGIKYILSTKDDVEIIGEAEDGLKLIKLLRHVTPDLVLLDINMPVMDGTAALLEIKKNYPNVKVLIVSMQNTPEMIEIMMHRGADGYLTKNDDPEKIYDAIKVCYQTGRYIDKRTEDVLLANVRRNSVKFDEDIKEVEPSTRDSAPSNPSPPAFIPSEPEIRKETAFPIKEEIPLMYRVMRGVLVGLGIAIAVYLGLYAYEKTRAKNVSEKPVTTNQQPNSQYEYFGPGGNYVDTGGNR